MQTVSDLPSQTHRHLAVTHKFVTEGDGSDRRIDMAETVSVDTFFQAQKPCLIMIWLR